MRRDGEDGCIASRRIVETVDQVHIAGAAASAAGGEFTRDLCFRTRGEGGRFFVPDVYPADAAVACEGFRDGVQAVAYNAVDPLDARIPKHADELIGDCFTHISNIQAYRTGEGKPQLYQLGLWSAFGNVRISSIQGRAGDAADPFVPSGRVGCTGG